LAIVSEMKLFRASHRMLNVSRSPPARLLSAPMPTGDPEGHSRSFA